jgi:hypothetical protein
MKKKEKQKEMLASSLTGLFDRNIQISRESRIENEKIKIKEPRKEATYGEPGLDPRPA